jgi:hypothetical protein
MQRKSILLIVCTLVIASWLLPPWDQIQSNGMSNGLPLYKFRGYHLIFQQPKVDDSLRLTRNGNVTVQPDWLFLGIEDFIILFAGWGTVAVSEVLRKRSIKISQNNH